MKKILLIILVIGGVWWFRNPLIGLFLDSSREKAFVNSFMENCFVTSPNFDAVPSLAISNKWEKLSEEKMQKLRLNKPGENTGEGWIMSDGNIIAVLKEESGYTCVLASIAEPSFSYFITSWMQKTLDSSPSALIVSTDYPNLAADLGNMPVWHINKGGIRMYITFMHANYDKNSISLKDTYVALLTGKMK